MLEKFILSCKYSGEQQATYNWGSLLHGALIEFLPPEVGEILHQSRLRPFSQYILPQHGKQLTWSIGVWNSQLAELVAPVLVHLEKVELKHKGLILEVADLQRLSISEQDYFARFFISAAPCRRYELEFLTPCTHKQDGTYALFPTPELIIKSLLMRYCSFSQDISLDDPETMQQLIQHLHIVRYTLRSAVYYLERTKITGYMGKLTLLIKGPEQLARLAGALLSFAEYAGVGIKTALGMGGVRISELYPPQEAK